MKVLTKSGIGLAAAFLVVSLSMGDQLMLDDPFCSCEQGAQVNTDYPLSHPKNRCAQQQISPTKISWGSWFRGQSIQFHYLDLLELLSRHEQSSQKPHA